jgi:hypothetical protein
MRLKETVEVLTGQRGTSARVKEASLPGVSASRTQTIATTGSSATGTSGALQTQIDTLSATGQWRVRGETIPAGYSAYFGAALRANADGTPGTVRSTGLYFGLTDADEAQTILDADEAYVVLDGDYTPLNDLFTRLDALEQVGDLYTTTAAATGILGNVTSFSTLASLDVLGVDDAYLFIVAAVNVKTAGGAAAMNATTEIQVVRDDAVVLRVQPTLYGAPITVNAMNTLMAFYFDGSTSHTYSLQARHAPSGGAAVTVTYEVVEFSIEVRTR